MQVNVFCVVNHFSSMGNYKILYWYIILSQSNLCSIKQQIQQMQSHSFVE